METLAIIIPCYNEQEALPLFYKEASKVLEKLNYDYKLLLINDGSKDNTLSIMKSIAKKDEHVKYLSFSRNFGKEAAMYAGFCNANADYVCVMDADMQDPPEVILEMINLWEQGNEVIYAKRKKRDGETAFKLFTAKMFYKILNGLSEVDIPKDTGDFRLADRKVIDVINSLPEHNKFLRGLFSWVGFKQVPLEYERKERYAGKTKYTLKKMLKLASDGIVGFSTKPFKIFGGLGVTLILISILLLIYGIVAYVAKLPIIKGWTSIMVTITLLSGIQLTAIWVISEYIGRIYDESKNRPQYIIDKKINIE